MRIKAAIAALLIPVALLSTACGAQCDDDEALMNGQCVEMDDDREFEDDDEWDDD